MQRRKRTLTQTYHPDSRKHSKKPKVSETKENENKSVDMWKRIPSDVLSNIFSYLELLDVISVSQVCKAFQKFAHHHQSSTNFSLALQDMIEFGRSSVIS